MTKRISIYRPRSVNSIQDKPNPNIRKRNRNEKRLEVTRKQRRLETENFFNLLPNELILKIMEYLLPNSFEMRSFTKLDRISKRWQSLANVAKANLINRNHFHIDKLGINKIPHLLAFLKNMPENLIYLDIKSFDVSDNQLTAIAKYCPNLRILKLSSEKISGMTLGKLAFLEKLEKLNIYYCHNLKFFPKKINTMSCLKVLNISYISQRKTTPPMLSYMPNLETLSMEGSFGSFGHSFEKLTHLKKLNCSNNKKIVSLPQKIGLFTELEKLDISGTKVDHLQLLGTLAKLKSFKADQCYKIQSTDILCSLISLREIIISSIPIKQLPEDFGNLINLEKLDLSYSDLETIPISFGKLRSLKKLLLKA